jgi:hypothetical protein
MPAISLYDPECAMENIKHLRRENEKLMEKGKGKGM